jgi:hypothetical protein
MKKITFILLLSFFFIYQVNAQFTVNRIDGTPFTNNETINFTTHSNTASELKFTVQNNATTNLDFRILCSRLVNTNGTNFQLCWGGECISSVSETGIYPGFQNIITAGGNTVGLNDNFKNFSAGDGVNYPMDFTFRIFTRDLAGNTVGTNFNLTYRYQGPLSIEQKDKLSAMGVKVLNTTVNNFVGLEISKPVAFSILNLQGQTITSGQLTENTNLNFASYSTGLYFINFKGEEGLVDAVKIYKK